MGSSFVAYPTMVARTTELREHLAEGTTLTQEQIDIVAAYFQEGFQQGFETAANKIKSSLLRGNGDEAA